MNWLRRTIAYLRGTFVTDCPRCYQYFFGNEPYMVQVKLERHYRIVCPNCAKESKKMDMVS